MIKALLQGVLRGSLFGLLASFIGLSVIPSCRGIFTPNKVAPQAKPYVKTFLKYCHQYQVDCSSISQHVVEIDTMDDFDVLFPNVIGVCLPAEQKVILNKYYWDAAGHADREQLVIHELGHCVLEKQHIEQRIGIMNPHILYFGDYILDYQELLDDFFDCDKDCPIVEFDKTRYTETER